MSRDAQVVYGVPRSRPGWELSQEKMPESVLHDEIAELLKAVLARWSRDDEGRFVRRHAGDAPAYSELLGAHVVTSDDGRRLRVASDAEGAALWPTVSEEDRRARGVARAEMT